MEKTSCNYHLSCEEVLQTKKDERDILQKIKKEG